MDTKENNQGVRQKEHESVEKRFFRRRLEGEIAKYLGRREMIGIRGPRQTGKTTLMRKFEEKTTGQKAFVNLDIPEYRRALEESPLDFVKRFRPAGEGRFTLFLDEIQRVRDAGEKLKIIYDELPGVRVFMSGSSSLEMRANVLPPLAGRLFLFDLMSFDFGEFMEAADSGLGRLVEDRHESLRKFIEGGDPPLKPFFGEEILRKWEEYAVFGGYPEVIKARTEGEKVEILRNIVALYLEKDIAAFFGIKDMDKFSDALKALSFETSGVLSLSSLASDIAVSHKKAETFLSALGNTYIIGLLRPFHRNLVTELKKAPKLHFLDLGIRNSVLGDLAPFGSRPDKAKLLETFVYRELLSRFSGWKLNYWRTAGGAEVDFVLSKGSRIVPVEVKISGDKPGKSFYSFLEAYGPERALIVTVNRFDIRKAGNTTVCWVPAYYL